MKDAFSHIRRQHAGASVDELKINKNLSIPMSEIDMRAVRAQGAGGQNVNKVATAIHLRFDISNSTTLPERVRRTLLSSGDQRITSDGVLIIKSQESRSQDRNRQAALERLAELRVEVNEILGELQTIFDEDLAAFNDLIRSLGLDPVVVKKDPPAIS